MSKIDRLLEKYAPLGVQDRELGELVEILDNLRRPVSRDKREVGQIPYYGANGIQGYVKDFLFDGEHLLMGEDGSVINPDRSPILNWAKGKIWVNNHAHVLGERADLASLRYVFHALQVTDISAVVRGVPPKINQANMRAIKLPVPPLEVQHEIVRILDTFKDLEAELEAELEARRTQFAFLLDQIFDNEEIRKNVLTILGDHGEFDRGNGLQKTDFSENGVGCIHYGQIYTKFGSHTSEVYSYVPEALADKLKKVKQGNLVITTTSENIQDVCKAVAWLGESEIVIGGHSCVYRHDLDPLFATYLFRSRLFQDQKNSYVQGTKVKDIKPAQISKIEVYVPPMKKQIKIGLMMRNFDALLQDVSIGLPAEIAARRQQYEYYRNKLLTFEPLEAA